MQIAPLTDIVAVVVWYNPTIEQAQNILSYIHDVYRVIIIDNSIASNAHLLVGVDQELYEYIPLKRNLGIATALNRGCEEAIRLKAKWILTMDQDSRWEREQLLSYFDQINSFSALHEVGVFSPRQTYNGQVVKYSHAYEDKIAVMTSGCLISANGFLLTKGFRDEFFIDEVDNEYCMHIKQLGMRVVIVNYARLAHQLGELRIIKLFGILEKEYIYHPPFRYYYMVRNILVLMKLYPGHRKFFSKRLKKLIKRILLYHNWNKIETIKMCLKGWQDAHRNIMGQLNEP